MIRALIFDFDGVIVLSEQARFQALQTIALRQGVAIRDDLFTDIVGRTSKDFFRLFLPEIQPEQLAAILANYQVEYKDKIIEHVSPIAFTTEFIRSYSGDKTIAVTSGSDSGIIAAVLEHIGLQHKISHIIGKEHVTKHKPDPQAYIYTAQQLHLRPNACVVFEDTAVGVQAALAAGMSVYAVLNGVNSEDDFIGLAIKGCIRDRDSLAAAAATA